MIKISGEWLDEQLSELLNNYYGDTTACQVLADRIKKKVETEINYAYEKGYFEGYHSTLGITMEEPDETHPIPIR